MRILPLLLAGLFVAAASRAEDPASLPSLRSPSRTRGKTIELKPGQALHVVLDANRTTGYSWSVEKIDAALSLWWGQPVYSTAEAKPGLMGVGGSETWHLLAVAAG